MKIIAMPRQGGKTRRLVELMLDGDHSGAIYVAADSDRARYAFNMAMGILEERGSSWDDSVVKRFRERFVGAETVSRSWFRSARRPVYLIDDLDAVLWALLNADVHTATITANIESITEPTEWIRS